MKLRRIKHRALARMCSGVWVTVTYCVGSPEEAEVLRAIPAKPGALMNALRQALKARRARGLPASTD